MADFTIYRGDTVKFNLALTANGVAYDLTDAYFWFTAKYNYGDADVNAVFQKTSIDGITITNALAGLAQVVIESDDTGALPNSKIPLLYDIQLKDVNGDIYTVAYGMLIVLPDVTQSTT